MKQIAIAFVTACSALILAGCYTPASTFRHVPATSPADPVPAEPSSTGGGGPKDPPLLSTQTFNPAVGEVSMALAASTVAFPKPDSDAKCAKGVDDAHPYVADDAWQGCLVLFGPPTVTPHASSTHYYVAWFGNGLNMSITPYDTDPFLPKVVKPGYKNPTADTIKRVGAEAATGAALGGWVGAIVVPVATEGVINADAFSNWRLMSHVDLVLTPTDKKNMDKLHDKLAKAEPLPKPPVTWADLVAKGYMCPSDTKVPGGVAAPPEAAKIRLPVAFDTDEALPSGVAAGCWHQFPLVGDQQGNQGWLFRFIEDDKADRYHPLGIPVYRYGNLVAAQMAHPKDYPSNDDTAYLKVLGLVRRPPPYDLWQQADAYYPAAGCHAVVLQIAWWKAGATEARNGGGAGTSYNIPHAGSFHVTVADPTLIQPTQLTKGQQTITVYPCGAIASSTPGGNDGADIEANGWSAIKDIRDAQATYAKDHAN